MLRGLEERGFTIRISETKARARTTGYIVGPRVSRSWSGSPSWKPLLGDPFAGRSPEALGVPVQTTESAT